MTVIFAPEYVWQVWLAALVVFAAGMSLVVARWRLGARYLGAARTTQILVSAGTAIAAVFLAIALAAPTLVRRGDRANSHVVVLLDVSDSMARAQGGLARVRAIASARLRRAMASADANATGQVLTFRSEVAAFGRPGPLRTIADRLDELPESAFAVGPGTRWDSYHHLGTDIYARERLYEQYDRSRYEPGVTRPRRRWRDHYSGRKQPGDGHNQWHLFSECR